MESISDSIPDSVKRSLLVGHMHMAQANYFLAEVNKRGATLAENQGYPLTKEDKDRLDLALDYWRCQYQVAAHEHAALRE